jgi:hypothetical protein
MAEIVRSRSTTTTTNLNSFRAPEETTKTVEYVTVRSLRSNRLDASTLYQFAEALKQAGAPTNVQIEGHRSDVGHLIQLTVKWNFEIPAAEPDEQVESVVASAAGREAACGSCDGARWVDDEGWQPEHEGEQARGRIPGSGRIPCGTCNHGDWDFPDMTVALQHLAQARDAMGDKGE